MAKVQRVWKISEHAAFSADKTARQIGRELGRSYKSVQFHAWAYDLPCKIRHKSTPEEREIALEVIASGKSIGVAAKTVARDKRTVRDWIKAEMD